LSTQNVHTLLNAGHFFRVVTYPEFIQLMDDDIVSLTALWVIIDPQCRRIEGFSGMSQLTFSLYLMTQCQLKLHQSATSLAQTLHYVKVARRPVQVSFMLDRLTLQLINRKLRLTLAAQHVD